MFASSPLINFTFLFDMSGMGYVNPKYCYKMSQFISELKEQEPFPFYKSSNLPNSKKHNKILEKKYAFINNKLK